MIKTLKIVACFCVFPFIVDEYIDRVALRRLEKQELRLSIQVLELKLKPTMEEL